ncbi:TPA: type II toxin-antitoxin system Phd/YefM family antitoxin [Serratia fonticola]
MKTISYTYMRDHLTEVLDELRQGEQITVTQRGKANLVLSSVLMGGKEISKGSKVHISNTNPILNRARESAKKRIAASMNKSAQTLGQKEVRTQDGVIIRSKRMSFEEAKERTKVRHAVVIKMLGDK